MIQRSIVWWVDRKIRSNKFWKLNNKVVFIIIIIWKIIWQKYVLFTLCRGVGEEFVTNEIVHYLVFRVIISVCLSRVNRLRYKYRQFQFFFTCWCPKICWSTSFDSKTLFINASYWNLQKATFQIFPSIQFEKIVNYSLSSFFSFALNRVRKPCLNPIIDFAVFFYRFFNIQMGTSTPLL